MKGKTRKIDHWTAFDTIVTILIVGAIIITLYPMIFVVACSLSDAHAVMAGKVFLWPVGFTLEAYRTVLFNSKYWMAFANSVIYVVCTCALMFFNTTVVAYSLTRPNLKFRKALTYYLLIPMYFNGGLIPTYLVITKLGLYDTRWALILPACYSIWNIILCRTYMASLPNDLIDSALIDGCDRFRTFTKIILPLSKPVIAVIMIYTIVGVWNEWFNASIYVVDSTLKPIQLYLKEVLNAANSGGFYQQMLNSLPYEQQMRLANSMFSAHQLKYAMVFVTAAPIIAVYPLFQKHFAKGIMIGSLKG